MAQWYVKELSKLTHVSVQTLHHYDRVDLLKPSVRLPNGYRLYSEKDLLKLQQIIALKFFGFELSQIKSLLSEDVNLIDHLFAQAQYLQKQASALFEASQTLKNIVENCSHDKSIPWETIIKSIEVYRMMQQLEKSWEGKVFNADELKKYVQFEQEIKKKFTASELKNIKSRWQDVIDEVNLNLTKDPNSELGVAIGKRAMEWVNEYYGREHIALRNAVWERGFGEGQVDNEHALAQESFAWLDQAITAYYRARIYNILQQLKTQPHRLVTQQWEELLNDMYGNEKAGKKEVVKLILADNEIDEAAKIWVKKYMEENL